MSIKESNSKKNYTNNYKKTSNIKVASAKQIKINNKLSNIIVNDLNSDLILRDLKKTGKSFIKKK